MASSRDDQKGGEGERKGLGVWEVEACSVHRGTHPQLMQTWAVSAKFGLQMPHCLGNRWD